MRARLLILTMLVTLSAGLMAGASVAIESENLYVDETRLESGVVRVTADNEEYAVCLLLKIDYQADGRYMTKDLVADSSWVLAAGTSDTMRIDSVRLAIGTTIPGRRAARGEVWTEGGQQYDLELWAPDALVGDTRFEDYEGEFGARDVQLVVQGQDRHGVVVVQAANRSGQAAAIAFVGEPGRDTVQVIADGTYEVSETMEAGTVMASPGRMEGHTYASYAGMIDKRGELTDAVWFVTEGQATVKMMDGVLHIALEGRNSYGRSVRVTIEADPRNRVEAVEEVRSEKREVRKEIREGRVVIVSGESVYGLMGSKLLDEGQRP